MQQLVDAAERERERAAERAAARDREAAAPPSAPPSPMRFAVYRRMHDGGFALPWMFAAITAVTVLLVAPSAAYIALAILGVCIVRLGIYVIGLLRGHRAFLQFPTDLAFPVDGWSALLGEELISNPEQWQVHAELVVHHDDTADREVIEAALTLCAAAANAHFYHADSVFGAATDPRVKWTREGSKISGSLNVWIIGDLYRVARRIDWIHRRSGGVTRIAFERSGGTYGISRPSAD